MSEVTTIARPYAKAAFDFAVEHKAVDRWAEMLTFAACVAGDDAMAELLTGQANAAAVSGLFLEVCGEQVDEYGQNRIKRADVCRYCLRSPSNLWRSRQS